MRVVWAVEAITLSFSTELDFTDCSMGFGEIRLKVVSCKRFKLFFGNFKWVFRRIVFVPANIF